MKKTFVDILIGLGFCLIVIALILFGQGRDTSFIYTNF